jgi:hypothetical protein
MVSAESERADDHTKHIEFCFHGWPVSLVLMVPAEAVFVFGHDPELEPVPLVA